MIPGWVDAQVSIDGLDGFNDEGAKLESEAWISLLEGTVHAAGSVERDEIPEALKEA